VTFSEPTEKERMVLTEAGRRHSNNEIAEELFISQETCKSDLSAISQKVARQTD